MKLGAFSVSLSVKDLETSKQFYENLGFSVYAGEMERNYLIMKNGDTNIGLFQGMFENNILTFNPGWDAHANKVDDFDDVRDIQKELKNKGLSLLSEADESTTGAASFMFMDPDGNTILIDQHV
ncbi:MAG: VOC family protein [Maribacter sp.]|nr:VOC family protein [Maribacter sp.]MBT8301094.1 VOC family protein [Maribacter sp.]NNK18838.1 VOC family protein [Maribacter sp.]